MQDDSNYIDLMDSTLKNVVGDAFRISLKNLPLTFFILRTILWQKKAARRRNLWEKRGVHVPPYLIASIIKQCNLRCKGCYAQAHRRPDSQEMPPTRWMEVFNEANELGISVILLAGGEPFLHCEILKFTKPYPNIIFPVFTNGLLLDEAIIQELEKQKHVIPVISIEGFEKETDERRGQGVYQQTREIFNRIRNRNIFFGVSITVTSANFNEVTGDIFIKELFESGCKLFIFVEYVPIEGGTEELVLSDDQKAKLNEVTRRLHDAFNGLFINFPGDEKVYDGCLASGRGFVHISPEGNLEPCPFAPYSDTNLKNLSLKEALQSELLKMIRDNHDKLSESKGGCALWENREWIDSLKTGNRQ